MAFRLDRAFKVTLNGKDLTEPLATREEAQDMVSYLADRYGFRRDELRVEELRHGGRNGENA